MQHGGAKKNAASGSGSKAPAATTASAKPPKPKPALQTLVAHPLTTLPAPERDAAAATDGKNIFVLAGLNSADVSTSSVVRINGKHAAAAAPMPVALHDAAATAVGGTVYLFGGADQSPSDAIFKVTAGGTRRIVGHLPIALSDVAATTIGDTAYVIGGYDGSGAVSTITAWKPGGSAKTVGHLPAAIRYAAVTALGGRIVMAGGTVGGAASRAILTFDPATGKVSRVGTLARPVTHAAAATLGSTAYVIGGRGSALNAQDDRISAITLDAAGAAKARKAGRIKTALSDLQAVTLGPRIVVIGGLDSQNVAHSEVFTLAPKSGQ